MPGEEYLFQIERQVPGFGGMYYDEQGDLVIFLKDLRLSGAAAAAVRPHLFGPGKRGMPGGPVAAIRFRQARYSFIELNGYWAHINQLAFQVPGVVATDVEEDLNRVEVTVRSAVAKDAVLNAVRTTPVPPDAVHVSYVCAPEKTGETCTNPGDGESAEPIEELPPAPELAEGDTFSVADPEVAPDDLPNDNHVIAEAYGDAANMLTSDYTARLRGGFQFAYRARNGRKQSFCTIGFNVRLGGGAFVTASHCSPRMGSSPNPTSASLAEAYYYQPKLGTGAGNYIGWEYLDPTYEPAAYWLARGNNSCPGNLYCRWSDALLVAYSTTMGTYGRYIAYGQIARTYLDMQEIDSRNPYFQVTTRADNRAVKGAVLYYVGSQSGLRSGKVGDTCQQGPMYHSNDRYNHMMCQDRVFFSYVRTGDSGAPVFSGSPTARDATLYGILSGGTGTYGYHVSHLRNIESDLGLGTLNVY